MWAMNRFSLNNQLMSHLEKMRENDMLGSSPNKRMLIRRIFLINFGDCYSLLI